MYSQSRSDSNSDCNYHESVIRSKGFRRRYDLCLNDDTCMTFFPISEIRDRHKTDILNIGRNTISVYDTLVTNNNFL